MNRPSHFREVEPAQPSIAERYHSDATRDPLARELGGFYTPPEIFEHGCMTQVAVIDPNPRGWLCRIYEMRCPEAWYWIEAEGVRIEIGPVFGTGKGDRSAAITAQIAFGIAIGDMRVAAIGGDHA